MKLRKLSPNMHEVTIVGNLILFSYKTPVAARIGDKFFKTSHRWSNTTSKHLSRWLAGVQVEEREQQFFYDLAR